jgi:outer membrane receptor for ferrienterochelin and colicin
VEVAGGGGARQVETDGDGRFVVEGLVAGMYAITAVSAMGEQGDARAFVVAGQAASVTVALVAAAATETLEVKGLSVAEQRRESAAAVNVVETEQARRETADLGDFLTRAEGVEVQRGGGLGRTRGCRSAG